MTGANGPMLPVAILAGGLATRLRPITETIPKALVDVAGRPFIAWQLELLRREGVTEVVVCAGYLGERIEEVVGDGAAYAACASATRSTASALLGTGGRPSSRAAAARAAPVFVLYGDSYLPIDMAPVQEAFDRARRGRH